MTIAKVFATYWPQMLIAGSFAVIGATGSATIQNILRHDYIPRCAAFGFASGLFAGICAAGSFILIKVTS